MRRPLRALIVENSENDALLILLELQRGSFDIIHKRVNNLTSLKKALKSQMWDVVISDYSLPDLSAIEVLTITREISKEIPFIIVSNTITDMIASEALRSGAQDFIPKENMTRLVPSIERALEAVHIRQVHKQTEEQLQYNKMRLAEAQKIAKLGYWDWDIPTDRMTWSEELYEIYGVTPAYFNHTFNGYLELVHPEDREYVTQVMEQAYQTCSSFSLYHRTKRPDGNIRTIFNRGDIVIDDKGMMVRLYGIAQDVTELKQMETALQESQRFIQQVANSSPNILYVYDLVSSKVVYVNNSLNTILGYETESIRQMSRDFILSIIHMEDMQNLLEYRKKFETLADGQYIEIEYRVKHLDGEYRWLFVRDTVFKRNISGRPWQILGAMQDITPRKRDEEQIQRQLHRITALRTIDMAISGNLDLHMVLNVILEQVVSQLKVDAANILLLNPYNQVLEYAAGIGFLTQGISHTHLMMGECIAGVCALDRKIICSMNLDEDKAFVRKNLIQDEHFQAYYCAPMIAKGQVKGVLEIFHRSTFRPDMDWLNFLESFAGQSAIAIDNATLFDWLQRSNVNLAVAYETTLEGWSRALDLRDEQTEGHSLRVTELTLKLARAMGSTDDELLHIRRGALLHDIGKMGIPDNILLKPGPLNAQEWEIMRRHPVYAYELLSPIPYLHPALDIPYCHHEKWDGSGYPRGLKGEQIPRAARIFAVIDLWDALTSDRPYRLKWSNEKVIQEIKSLSGSHFDPKVVDTFLRVIAVTL